MKNRLSVCIFLLCLALAATGSAQTPAPAASAASRQVIPAKTDRKEVPPEVMQRINDETKVPFKYGIVIRGETNQFVDCPSIFRQNGQWYMVYISTTSKTGYETFLARSADLLHWDKLGKIMSFRPEGWDKAQVAGGIALCDPTWGGGSELQTFDGKYWMSYIGGPNPGMETPPLAIGMAWTKTPAETSEWNRISENPVLGKDQTDARWFETGKHYKSQIIWDKSQLLGHPFVMYYNAQGPGGERIGMAVSDDMIHWQRYGDNPVVANGTREKCGISGDPQIVKIGDMWVMFYFGYWWKQGVKGGFDNFACSYDLVHWTQWQGEPQVKKSESWDSGSAHKPWVIKHDGVVYHFYCATSKDGRFIALATSKDLKKDTDKGNAP
jgi:predicted GH43/DUF377 family glycosyl hydrolase